MFRSLPLWTILGVFTFAACADPVEPDPMRTDAGARDSGPTRDAGETVLRDAGPRDGGETGRDAGPRDGGDVERDGGTARDGGPRVIEIEVAYTADTQAPLIAELYLTESSTTRARVTPQLAGGPTVGSKGDPEYAGVRSFEWTIDRGILYVAQQENFDIYEIFIAPNPGDAVTSKLSNATTDRPASSYDLSPDGRWISFGQSVPGEAGTRRFVVEVDAAAQPIRVSQGTSLFPFWRPGADGLAFQDIIVSASDRDLWYYDVSVTPPVGTRLNTGANLGFAGLGASWSRNGQYVVFSADDGALRVFQPYRVTFTNDTPSAPEPIYATFPATADIEFGNEGIQFAPQGTLVAFLADVDTDQTVDLYVVDAAGTLPATPTRLTAPFAAGRDGVQRFRWNDAGTHILFAADYDIEGRFDLYLTDVTGPNGVRVNAPVATTDFVGDEQFVHGDSRLIYTRVEGNEQRVKTVDLSAAPFGAPVDLGVGQRSGFGPQFEVSPSEDWMIHTAVGDPPTLRLTNLRAATPTTTTVITTIADIGFSSTQKWCWAPDDRLLVVRDDGQLGLVEDFTSSDTFVVSGPLATDGRVTACAFPPEPIVDED